MVGGRPDWGMCLDRVRMGNHTCLVGRVLTLTGLVGVPTG